jgi:hypothetical protein
VFALRKISRVFSWKIHHKNGMMEISHVLTGNIPSSQELPKD